MADKTMMTSVTNPHPIALYHQKKALIRVIAKFLYAQWGQQSSIPRNSGETIIWSRWANLLSQDTPLTQGLDPDPVTVTRTDLRATVAEYGLLTKQTSWLKLTGLSQESDRITDVILDNMRLTLDTLCRNALVGTASSTTCSSSTSGTAEHLNKTDIDTVVTNLEGENASMLRPQIGAGTGQGTSPIRAAYIAIGHTAQRPRLEAVAGFKHVSNYPSENIMEGEFCSTGDVRWLLTTNAYYSGLNYHNMIIAEDFFGNVQINGGSAEGPLIYTPPEATGSGLRRYSLLGWLTNYACMILNDNFGHDLISYI